MSGFVRSASAQLLMSAGCLCISSAQAASGVIPLPPPELKGPMSVEQALQQRRSIREFSGEALDLSDISQILWAAQGKTGSHGLHTTPSAGGLAPLEIYLLAGKVSGMAPGVYRYRVDEHALGRIRAGDLRTQLAAAAHGQTWAGEAPALLVIAADYQRTRKRYGSRAERYVHIEAGHAAQNVYLQCTARGAATVLVGAFDDGEVARVLGLPAEHVPLGLMPLGWPR